MLEFGAGLKSVQTELTQLNTTLWSFLEVGVNAYNAFLHVHKDALDGIGLQPVTIDSQSTAAKYVPGTFEEAIARGKDTVTVLVQNCVTHGRSYYRAGRGELKPLVLKFSIKCYI